MSRADLKHALISLLIGLVITFLSSLLSGVIEILKGYVSTMVGGTGGAVAYLYRHYIC